ncbi:outer membrane protein assembly factor BamE [Myxococcus sp. RHSTA-1-4]|uniref:outer membrane protein assembly factor BamE n=1 Tax=Myxococcus sp. RHSTA-1-4 TaxID=2874601 RepID=UPI001CC03A95|nr:outer membrane protein assembly factor BamE [Myxococcus sp. RHSTA-1-4]MBZ4421739.1 outer membrane protein assembly factor BamE [Myxococcus sp. RHSTA-1-4]
MRTSLLTAAALAFAAAGCATSGGFDKLYPGMSSQQVVEAMGSGPSRAQEFPDKSTAWYYGEDRCVLMREDKLVAKATSEDNTSIDTPVVSVRDTSKALCAPEGYVSSEKRQQEIDTPFGTYKGNIDPSAAVKKVKDMVTGQEEPAGKSEQATTPAP